MKKKMDLRLGKKLKKNQCYCAFCRTPRAVYRKRHINFVNILYTLVASVILMLGIWQTVDPRALLFWLGLMLFSEIMIQIRWRITIVCRHCGFDPILYLKKPEAAADKVKNILDQKRSSSDILLIPPYLQTIIKERPEALKKSTKFMIPNTENPKASLQTSEKSLV